MDKPKDPVWDMTGEWFTDLKDRFGDVRREKGMECMLEAMVWAFHAMASELNDMNEMALRDAVDRGRRFFGSAMGVRETR